MGFQRVKFLEAMLCSERSDIDEVLSCLENIFEIRRKMRDVGTPEYHLQNTELAMLKLVKKTLSVDAQHRAVRMQGEQHRDPGLFGSYGGHQDKATFGRRGHGESRLG